MNKTRLCEWQHNTTDSHGWAPSDEHESSLSWFDWFQAICVCRSEMTEWPSLVSSAVMSGQESQKQAQFEPEQARDESRSKNALRAEHQVIATSFTSPAEISDRCNVLQTTTSVEMINEGKTGFHTGSCQRWIATLRFICTSGRVLNESAIWKLILICVWSYKSLFHKSGVLTSRAFVTFHHRKASWKGKLHYFILPQGVRDTMRNDDTLMRRNGKRLQNV